MVYDRERTTISIESNDQLPELEVSRSHTTGFAGFLKVFANLPWSVVFPTIELIP